MVLHDGGAKILAVGHEDAEHHGGGERDHDEPHIAAEALAVLQDQVDAQHHQQGTPGDVGEDEPLAEGDGGIQRRLGGPVIIGDEVLDDEEHGQIDRQVEAPPGVGMGLEEMLDGLHGACFPPETDLR